MYIHWSEKDGIHSVKVRSTQGLIGSATIEPYSASHMTTFIMKDEKGIVIDGYALASRGLRKEKKDAESRLKQLSSK